MSWLMHQQVNLHRQFHIFGLRYTVVYCGVQDIPIPPPLPKLNLSDQLQINEPNQIVNLTKDLFNSLADAPIRTVKKHIEV